MVLELRGVTARMTALRIGKFQVLGQLGTGAHSTILHIRRSADARSYALKVVPIAGSEEHKFLQQARHELRVAEQLDHPNLIKIYALETQRDWLFRVRKAHLLIEYVNGRTLDTCQRIPMPRLVQVFQRIAGGMVHMHRRGIYHADLKPNNILLSRTGEVKVIDYGLAWIKGENKDRVQGTPEYMAPEQAKKSIVNEQTDIFNFGATMYRLVAWRNPPAIISTDDGGMVLDGKVWQKLLTPVGECSREAPPALCNLIHHCLAYHAGNRPGRMNDVLGELDDLARQLVRSDEDRLETLPE
jgi:serine/threonine protein kinase